VSHLDTDGQAAYAARLTGEIEAHRLATGLPQWLAVDEAHGPSAGPGQRAACSTRCQRSPPHHLRPGELSADAFAFLDASPGVLLDETNNASEPPAP
jgi:hypothetical protein